MMRMVVVDMHDIRARHEPDRRDQVFSDAAQS